MVKLEASLKVVELLFRRSDLSEVKQTYKKWVQIIYKWSNLCEFGRNYL